MGTKKEDIFLVRTKPLKFGFQHFHLNNVQDSKTFPAHFLLHVIILTQQKSAVRANADVNVTFAF